MSPKTSVKGFLIILCICSMVVWFIVSPTTATNENRTPTMISIALDPANPQSGQEFYITGTLISATGEPLGNKWIILESTAAGAVPGKFQFLKITQTDRDGTYSFYRPAASPPEDLRAIFKGLYTYAGCMSDEVSVKK